MARNLLRAALTALLVGVSVALVAVAAAPAVGYRAMLLTSGSMAPTYEAGGMVLLDEGAAPDTIDVGDVITYESSSGDGLTTHRVVAVERTPTGSVFTTRGDANPAEDPTPVPAAALRGRVAADLSVLAPVLTGITAPSTQLAILAFAAVWVVGAELWRRRPGWRPRPEQGATRDVPRPPPPPAAATPAGTPLPPGEGSGQHVVVPGWAVPDGVWVRVPADLLQRLPPPPAPRTEPSVHPTAHDHRAEVVAAPEQRRAEASTSPVQVPDSIPSWLLEPAPAARPPSPPASPSGDTGPPPVASPDRAATGDSGPLPPGGAETTDGTPAVAFSSRSASAAGAQGSTARRQSWLRRLVLGLLVGLVLGALGSAAVWTSWAVLTDSDLVDVAALTSKDLVAPANVTASGGCTLLLVAYVDLSWDGVTGADEYVVLRRTGTDAFSEVTRVTTTSHRDDTVSGSTTFDYRIVTAEAGWESEQSATASASVPLCL